MAASRCETRLKTSIIIPLFGPEHFLTACLSAITDNTEGDYDVIVVDNATGYDLSGAPNLAAIVRNKENLGFAVACNQGAKCSKSEILCFLNVDTEVQPGWLPNLLTAFDDPEVVMAGPRIVHPAGDLQTAGLHLWHGSGSAGGQEIKEDLHSRDVDGVTGACMMIRCKEFFVLGMFDTDFQNGYEDCALCMSATEAGYRIRYVAESQITHWESAAGGTDRWANAGRNVETMNRKWGNR